MRGNIKVMVGVNGTRIQEEIGDSIKVYSLNEWQEELKKRNPKDEVSKPKKDEEIKLPSLDEGDGDFEGVNDAPVLKKRGRKKSA